MGKAESTKGESSRRRILIEAFRLFATLPYERVSFSLMEKEIGISRGSMVYYFKNKEGLFREVLNTLVLGTSSVKSVPEAYRGRLRSFYTYFIETLVREKETFVRMDVTNLNEALMRIENSALTYVEGFKEYILNWYDEEIRIWVDVISNAISSGEIRNNLDAGMIAGLYEDTYLGQSFKGVFKKEGYEPVQLKATYDVIYELIRQS